MLHLLVIRGDLNQRWGISLNDNRVDAVRVSFPLRISFLVVAIAVVFDVLFYIVTQDLKDTLLFTSASAAAAGTVLASFYSARVLSHQVKQHDQAKLLAEAAKERDKCKCAFDFVAKWTAPHMQEARKTCRQVANLKGQSLEEVKKIIDTEDETSDVFHLLNFFEEMSLLIKYDVADGDVLKEAFQEPLAAIYVPLQLWMDDHKKQNDLTEAWTGLAELQMEWSS